MVVSTEQIECPVCGNYANIHDLGRAGLVPEQLLRIRQYIKDGALGKLLTIAEMIERRIDPTTTSMELSFNETLERLGSKQNDKLDELVKTLRGISEKIVGPGIGEVSEVIAAQEFVQTFPKDEFDTSQSEKKGTDLVANVFDKNTCVGKISISIKNTKTWKNEFLQQLEKNVNHDSAKVGILITSKLPRGTNPKGHVIQSNGNMFFLVAPDYAIASYAAIRQIVINMHNTQQYIDSKEKELIRVGKISKAFARWISGQEYEEILSSLTKIQENCENSRNELIGLQGHVDRKIKKVCDRQTSTQRELLNTEGLLSGLKEILQKTGEDNHED